MRHGPFVGPLCLEDVFTQSAVGFSARVYALQSVDCGCKTPLFSIIFNSTIQVNENILEILFLPIYMLIF